MPKCSLAAHVSRYVLVCLRGPHTIHTTALAFGVVYMRSPHVSLDSDVFFLDSIPGGPVRCTNSFLANHFYLQANKRLLLFSEHDCEAGRKGRHVIENSGVGSITLARVLGEEGSPNRQQRGIELMLLSDGVPFHIVWCSYGRERRGVRSHFQWSFYDPLVCKDGREHRRRSRPAYKGLSTKLTVSKKIAQKANISMLRCHLYQIRRD